MGERVRSPGEQPMSRTVRVLTMVCVTGAGLLSASSPAGSTPGSDASSEHRRVVSYWTPQARASAVPRDVMRPGEPPKAAARPGGGGGGGGVVTGATWTGGGDVVKTTGKVFFTLNGSRYTCSASAVA